MNQDPQFRFYPEAPQPDGIPTDLRSAMIRTKPPRGLSLPTAERLHKVARGKSPQSRCDSNPNLNSWAKARRALLN